MERNRSLVESTGKELQELTERNLQLISKIEQLEKQLRAKEELTRRFISDKERLLANMTNEK
jgi:flagellar biosynthesis/type III secretory pathway chaperone